MSENNSNNNNYNFNNNNNNNYIDLQFKYIMVGDSGVGKSCILHHFIFNRFKKDSTQTIGVDFSSKNIIINNNVKIKLQIWDTAGQEKFRSVVKNYYRGAIGVLIVFDLTKNETFSHVKLWLNDVKNYARNECSIIIIGNKNDLNNKRNVKNSFVESFCEENNCLYIETSAINGENINKTFIKLSENIMNKIEKGEIDLNSVKSTYEKEMKKVIIAEQNNLINKDDVQSYCGGYC